MHQHIGKTYNLLTVISVSRNEKGAATCVCKCSCGQTTKPVLLSNVTRGNTKSCGGGHHRRKDWTGRKFGRLTALKFDSMKGESAYWLFQCECGTKKVIRSDGVTSGVVRSCGCLMREKSGQRMRDLHTTHGKSGSKIYITWKSMLVRCYKTTDASYARYGGRGIKVLWQSFEEFYADMGEPPSPDHSVERKDNNGHYCKENCVWATKKTQANNRRTTDRITRGGRTQSLKQWAEELGISYKSVWWRVNQADWDLERALTTPIRHTVRGY